MVLYPAPNVEHSAGVTILQEPRTTSNLRARMHKATPHTRYTKVRNMTYLIINLTLSQHMNRALLDATTDEGRGGGGGDTRGTEWYFQC